MSEASTDAATTTAAVEPIEINGGEGPVTFDDLERVEAQSKAAKRAEKNQVKDAVEKTVKALDKNKKDSDKDKDDDEDADESEEADDSKEKPKKEDGKKEDKPKLEKPNEAKKKILKGKLGDKELELDPDTVVRIPIDGKEEEVSIRDLQRHFTGKTSWEKKFSELDSDKKQFTSKVQVISDQIKSIFDEDDVDMRLFRMAELSGKDPKEVRAKFLESNIKFLENYYSMTDDEREADAREFENKILRHRLEFKEKAEARRNAEQALQSKIQNLGTTHKIPEETFRQAHDQLRALKAEGTFHGKITPEFVVETIQKENLWSAAEEALKDSSMPQSQMRDALLNLVDTAYAQGLGPQEVREIADELWGSTARSNVVEEKLAEQEELRTGKKGSKKPEYTADSEVWSFDQL